MSAGNIADCIGRPRQSVQRALERYELGGLVERFPSYVRKRTEGWGLTEKGRGIWDRLEFGFAQQEKEIANRVNVRGLLFDLENLMIELRARSRGGMSLVGLIEPPSASESLDDDH